MLRKVAVNREVMVAVANSQAPGLQGFLDSIKALNIPNFMVVAIDAALAKTLTASVRFGPACSVACFSRRALT